MTYYIYITYRPPPKRAVKSVLDNGQKSRSVDNRGNILFGQFLTNVTKEPAMAERMMKNFKGTRIAAETEIINMVRIRRIRFTWFYSDLQLWVGLGCISIGLTAVDICICHMSFLSSLETLIQPFSSACLILILIQYHPLPILTTLPLSHINISYRPYPPTTNSTTTNRFSSPPDVLRTRFPPTQTWTV